MSTKQATTAITTRFSRAPLLDLRPGRYPHHPGPLFDRMWVGETPILRPRPGQILFALELGESIEVALSADAVLFVHLYMR